MSVPGLFIQPLRLLAFLGCLAPALVWAGEPALAITDAMGRRVVLSAPPNAS